MLTSKFVVKKLLAIERNYIHSFKTPTLAYNTNDVYYPKFYFYELYLTFQPISQGNDFESNKRHIANFQN